MKFYDLAGNEISKKDFISYYSEKYYKRNFGRNAEEIIDKALYEKNTYSINDIYYILAWKIDGIDRKKTNDLIQNPNGTIHYYKGWNENKLCGYSWGNQIELEKVLTLCADLSVVKKEWMKKPFADDETGAAEILIKLANSGAKGMGSVYYLTLLYFLTGSRWPIYDSMAYMAISAIQNELIPSKDTVKYSQKLPDKSNEGEYYPESLSQIVLENSDSQYRRFVNFLKEFEEDIPEDLKYTASRDIDRALWEYGHYF